MKGLYCIFAIEGNFAAAELWADEWGYQLYVEEYPYRPKLYTVYNYVGDDHKLDQGKVLEEAWQDAKRVLMLEDWNFNYFDFLMNTELDDREEWDAFKSACEASLQKERS
jgi:hypothetical protein